MSVAVAEKPHILHSLPGRIRIHVPGWSEQGKRAAEIYLRQVPGVNKVEANPLTSNILLYFDSSLTDAQTLLEAVGTLQFLSTEELPQTSSSPPPAVREKQGNTVRVRVAVRGLDRDPQVAKRVIEHLESQPGVHARANPLTGRVLIEFAEHEADLDDILSSLTDLELPELPDEDRPAYPLDPGPLRQSTIRVIGATAGLSFLALRRLLNVVEPLPGSTMALRTAGIIGIVHSIPFIRNGLRRLLGHTATDLIFALPSIVTLTLAGSPLGLALSGLEALRLLTEVRARRAAWHHYEKLVGNAPPAQPDAIIRLENAERTPLAADVLEGTGTALGQDGMPVPVVKGTRVPGGARLYGNSFLLQLRGEASFETFTPEPRPAPIAPTLYNRYQQIIGTCSLIYAGITTLFTRSFDSTLTALLLVNARPATIGRDNANLSASARVLHEGVTVVGTRPQRVIRRPHLILLDGARLLTDKLELASIHSFTETQTPDSIQTYAASITGAANFPWGGVFGRTPTLATSDGTFDGKVAAATIEGVRYSLGPVEDWSAIPEAAPLRQRGEYVLVLQNEHQQQPLALISLRPQLAAGVQKLVASCQRNNVALAVLACGDQIAVQALARRAQIPLTEDDDALGIIRTMQQDGKIVAFISDNIGASAAFAACDLGIGLTDGHSRLPARADLLAPGLSEVAAIIEAASRREATTRDAVGLSMLSNIIGMILGFRSTTTIRNATNTMHISSLLAMLDGWLRLRGGSLAPSTRVTLVDPQPERWGRMSIAEVLHIFNTTEEGLTDTEALKRRQQVLPHVRSSQLLKIVLEQVRSPLIGILATGAGLSLIFGAVGDVTIIALTIALSIAMSTWQEHKANQIAETLQQMSASSARIVRDLQPKMIPITEIVPGDILILASGDRVAADARIISAQGLEVDESALTGESLPQAKVPNGTGDIHHIVLEGSDVTAGTGRAIVVAVGQHTRMGATRAALTEGQDEASPLGTRLSRMLSMLLPLSIAGGIIVIGSGWLWGQPLTSLLALGVTVTLAAVPEGLPLLAKASEVGVAHRLAEKQTIIRRLSAVEALGRVDVACADKTGTMTKGRLQLSLIADRQREAKITDPLSPQLQHVLLAAALACPPPDTPGVENHPTDMAVIQGAIAIGLGEQLKIPHDDDLQFDPTRSFYATHVQDHLYLKGAPEVVLPRCLWVRQNGRKRRLDERERQRLIRRSLQFAQQGLRILMVAENGGDISMDDPQELVALGFVGISDPLRNTVRAAVYRCHEAGVRVLMITGDHPSTARAIAEEAGLMDGQGEVLVASDIAELQNSELDQQLARAVVIARATPLDKLRIIESLRRQGHTVAMTGDGVNDAPALRLADVGIAMGGGSTEVARQTADIVITNDDFSTLVETFVEGRSFWRNIRRSLGLLLGGNLGELGLILGATIFGAGIPLNAPQILAVNAITDILPALAVALQEPEHRNLAELRREGTSALGVPLRNEILRRAIATTVPSLASYLITLSSAGQLMARSTAFASIIATQLAQTLDTGRSEGHLTKSVSGAVAGSLGVLALAFAVPPLRTFLGLTILSPVELALVAGGALLAVLLSHLLALPPLRDLDFAPLLAKLRTRPTAVAATA